MEIITVYPDSIDRRAIETAARILKNGGLVIYPTDTHPALAADALNSDAVAELCRLKGVDPEKHTLTLVCDSIASAAQYARIDDRAFRIVKQNTPGAVTFILPPMPSLPKVFKKRKQLGVRIPGNEISRALAAEFGRPLLSGSLGETDPTELESHVDLLINDASAEYTYEVQSSSIVDLMDSTSPEVIREGSVKVDL